MNYFNKIHPRLTEKILDRHSLIQLLVSETDADKLTSLTGEFIDAMFSKETPMVRALEVDCVQHLNQTVENLQTALHTYNSTESPKVFDCVILKDLHNLFDAPPTINTYTVAKDTLHKLFISILATQNTPIIATIVIPNEVMSKLNSEDEIYSMLSQNKHSDIEPDYKALLYKEKLYMKSIFTDL